VTGLEPSAARGAVARERYGIRILPSYLEEAELDEVFDILVLRHVIEHFSSPFDMIVKARDLLADNGLMVVIVPNIDCIGRYLFGTDWTWVLPWHCNFFNPKSLKILLHKAGLEPVTMYQTPSPLYYPESFARKFPDNFLSRHVARHGMSSLLFSVPFALVGWLAGHTDNITLIARKG
jgi:hypothetical protein